MVPASANRRLPIERVQIGVRMERSMVKVLKALAEFEGLTLGQLLEKIVLHSFEPVPGQEGEMSASPHSRRALNAIADFKRIYSMDVEGRELRRPEPSDGSL
jgi:predicted DNA-binding ribbon-helix-helix protein